MEKLDACRGEAVEYDGVIRRGRGGAKVADADKTFTNHGILNVRSKRIQNGPQYFAVICATNNPVPRSGPSM